MSELRALTTGGREAPAERRQILADMRPGMGWVALADCVVDDSYQREISRKGWANIAAIAQAFSWRKFAPLIVARAHGAPTKWAIVDGQHRGTAALICGFEQAPAMMVEADRRDQAAMFNAINAVVTPVSALTAHAAAVASGDELAVAVKRATDIAGVIVCKYPVPADKMAPGMTLAVGVLKRCLAQFGHDVLVTALQCVTETSNNYPGALSGIVIKGICMTLARREAWRDLGGPLLEAFDEIDLDTYVDRVRSGRGGGRRRNASSRSTRRRIGAPAHSRRPATNQPIAPRGAETLRSSASGRT